MEFLDGEPLDRAIAPGDVAAAPARRALEILDGLEPSTGRLSLHCDLKPANVLHRSVVGRAHGPDRSTSGSWLHLAAMEHRAADQRAVRRRIAPGSEGDDAGSRHPRSASPCRQALHAASPTSTRSVQRLYRVLVRPRRLPGRNAAEIRRRAGRARTTLGPLRAMKCRRRSSTAVRAAIARPRAVGSAARDLRELCVRIAWRRGRREYREGSHAAGDFSAATPSSTTLRDALRGRPSNSW